MSYKLLTFFLWPVFFLYTIKVALRDKSSRYFLQRLGFTYPKHKNKTIWIHCASVGEVNTYLSLHLKLLDHFPDKNFIITTNTVTGAYTVNRHKLPRTQHCYLPIESGLSIRRFIRTTKPSMCLIMETEIWPLLYKIVNANNIPISIINARLSHRTLSANHWVKSVYKTSLTYVDKILCKSTEELNNFKTLGAHNKQLIVAGNLKFAFTSKVQAENPIKLDKHTYCLAASTHHDEELQLASLWKKLNPEMLLVIAPRHPNRSRQIQKQFDSININYAVRSQSDNLQNNTEIYLADTLGELTGFMMGAEFVFIGGSLVKHGGQNILESCRIGKATLCGPHMFNFTDEMNFLLKNNACIQVDNISQLESEISAYFQNPGKFNSVGTNAKKALLEQTKILDLYLSSLSGI